MISVLHVPYVYVLPLHSVKANLGCDTNWVSNLISSDIRSKGFNKVGVSFWELTTETWIRIDNLSILTQCIPLWSVNKWLLKLEHNDENVSILDTCFKFFRKVMDSTVYLNNVFL